MIKDINAKINCGLMLDTTVNDKASIAWEEGEGVRERAASCVGTIR